MKFLIVIGLIAIMSAIGFSQAQKAKDNAPQSTPAENHRPEKGHEHGAKGHEYGNEEAHKHSSEEGRGHGHGHEEGEKNNVGPDKGVLEAREGLGFKLREGVEERFGIKSQRVSSGKPGNLPKEAIVYSKEDYQIFRKRNGFWKPITVKAARKGDVVSIDTGELKAGDQVAIDGTGFLKIVELSVFGPAIEGHIH